MKSGKTFEILFLICFYVLNTKCGDNNKIRTEDIEGIPLQKNVEEGLLKSKDEKNKKRNLMKMGNKFSYKFSANQNFIEKPKPEQPRNPHFNKSFHSSEKNYFQLSLNYERSKGTLLSFQLYIKKWFNIDEECENLFVEELKINDKPVHNRFKVKYFNKATSQNKMYYFDVNFMDNKGNAKKYKKIKAPLSGSGSDSAFMGDYEYTLNMECLAIQKMMFNPQEIKCEPIVNKQNYLVFHAYKATMLYVRGKNRKTVVKTVYVQAGKENPAPNLTPKKKNKMLTKKGQLPSVISLIKFRLTNMKTFVPYRTFEKYLYFDPLIVGAANRVSLAVEISGLKIAHIRKSIEKGYQERLKKVLFNQSQDNGYASQAFEKTYELMHAKVDQLNAFEIESSLRKSIRELDFKTQYKAHQKKADHFAKEIRMNKLLDKYDYLRYIEDNNIDETYRLN